jgi:SAM-dependent methyltransferase
MPDANWNTFARVNASQRWRKSSAAMGRNMTEAIVAEARIEPGMTVLDVACGTGEPAISIATLLDGTGKVVASDVSESPLKVAEQRATQRGLINIEFVPCDVHRLPFADATFDRVTSRLGAMFFSDFPRALTEIRRVLKPGGRVSLVAWGPMQQPYFESTIGTVLHACPDLTLPASGAKMFKFGQPGTLTAAFQAAGFGHTEERTCEVPWNWPGTPEEVWQYFQEVTIPFKPLFDAIPADRRADVDQQVVNEISRFYDGGEVKFAAKIVLASAVR